MAHYVIGDVQGCYTVLEHLLATIDFNYGKDTIWFAGDIINRGPQSLETIRFIKKHDDCMQTVLGNHDLHLLYLANNQPVVYKKKDTLAPIIHAPDKKELIDWLRLQPMYLQNDDYIVVHAGIFPAWSLADTIRNGDEISDWFKSCQYRQLLDHMYGDYPDLYSSTLQGFGRLRFNINVFTRMRALYRQDKRMDFKFKSSLKQMPMYLDAWFNFENPNLVNKMVLFGHWSALGIHQSSYAICLDSGAVWGGRLTAYNLDTHEMMSVVNTSSIDLS